MHSLAEIAQLYLRFANETAFVHRRGYRTLRWSYRQIAELAFRFARELERRGISKGERILLWGENCPEWVAAFLGCMLRGVVAVPMDKIAAPDFMQRVANDVEAKLIVCSTSLAESARRRPHLELESLSEALADLPGGAVEPVALSRDDTAQIVFTSGT